MGKSGKGFEEEGTGVDQMVINVGVVASKGFGDESEGEGEGEGKGEERAFCKEERPGKIKADVRDEEEDAAEADTWVLGAKYSAPF